MAKDSVSDGETWSYPGATVAEWRLGECFARAFAHFTNQHSTLDTHQSSAHCENWHDVCS